MGMLLGLVKPTSGNFNLLGAGTPHQEALRRTGAIVETPSFYPYLSGRNNLAYFQGYQDEATPGSWTSCSRKSTSQTGQTTVSAPIPSA